jgi:hypothetical protein
MVFLSPGNRSGDPPDRTPLPLPPAVWVRLDAVFPHPADARQTSVPEGLDLVGNASGSMRRASLAAAEASRSRASRTAVMP